MNSSSKIVLVGTLLAASFVFAQEVSPFDTQGLTPEQAEKFRERQIRKLKRIQERGGWAETPPTGGVVRVVSAQAKVSRADLASTMDVFSQTLRIPLEWCDDASGVSDPAKLYAAANKDGRCAIAVVLVDDPSAPRLLVAPEDGWAMVNLAKLAEDNPPRTQLVRRAGQEYWRASSLVLGCYTSMQQPCLMTPIYNNVGLDNNVCLVPAIEVLPKISATAKGLGIRPGRRVVYERAVREGWAPAPTNDVQRAVWEAVKAEQSKNPEKAIKIEYDPKKGK